MWCLPKPDFELRGWMRTALRIPGLAALLHGVGLAAVEAGSRVLVSTPLWAAAPMMRAFDAGAKRAYRAYLRRVIKDPALVEQLVPCYGPVAKRPTLSNDFLRTFNRANTSLITKPIERITRTGILTTDGIQHDLDMIVLATGYHLFSDPESYLPGAVVGRDGFDLGAFFAEHRLQAYESVALPKLPNRWMIVGPYSWTGTGWHALVEITARHAARAIAAARDRGATMVEVRQRAHDAYHARIRRRGRNIQHYFAVQNRGLRTYYVNSQGDMPYIRPSTVLEARWRSRHFPLDDYAYETHPVGQQDEAVQRRADPVEQARAVP